MPTMNHILRLPSSVVRPARCSCARDAELQTFVDSTLTEVRTRADLPAVASLVQIDGKIEAQAAIGVRAVGQRQP